MRRRSGFVLMMAIVLLAIAAATMVQLANRSMAIVQQGVVAQRETQERWSQITARIAFLERGEELLSSVEARHIEMGGGWPFPRQIVVHYQLGGERFQVQLSDECAKISINALAARHPEDLRTLLAQAAMASRLPLKLAPRAPKNRAKSRAYWSWGQVVDLSQLLPEEPPFRQLQAVTDNFTCWGSDRLNLRRAQPEAIRIVLAGILSPKEIEEFQLRCSGYQGELEELIKSLDLPRRKVIKISPLITDTSSTYAMWIHRPQAENSSATLIVQDPTDRSGPQILQFEW